MSKILFVATVPIHFQYFYLPYFKMLGNKGWEVHIVCSCPAEMPHCDKIFDIPIARSPLRTKNIAAYRQLKKIINDNQYDVIHCNTPMGGVLARLAARKTRKRGAKVIYTAHGFHFFMGAPVVNWFVYYPIEYVLSRFTDCLITINEEDYTLAKKHFRAGKILHIHGVGYDEEKFSRPKADIKRMLREKNGYDDTETLLIYVAELNINKNQGLLLEALKIITEKHKNVRLLLIGPDANSGKYQKMAVEMGLEKRVDFLGRRDDIENLMPMCDIAVASSLREGLPVNIMEALACGLPVAAADNRGHRALIVNNLNGFITKPNDPREMAQKVMNIIEDSNLYQALSSGASDSVKKYSRKCVIEEMRALYEGL